MRIAAHLCVLVVLCAGTDSIPVESPTRDWRATNYTIHYGPSTYPSNTASWDAFAEHERKYTFGPQHNTSFPVEGHSQAYNRIVQHISNFTENRSNFPDHVNNIFNHSVHRSINGSWSQFTEPDKANNWTVHHIENYTHRRPSNGSRLAFGERAPVDVYQRVYNRSVHHFASFNNERPNNGSRLTFSETLPVNFNRTVYNRRVHHNRGLSNNGSKIVADDNSNRTQTTSYIDVRSSL